MKRKKKMLAAVIAVVLLAVIIPGVNPQKVKAAADAKVTVSSEKGGEGDTVKVDVSVTENPGMCGMTIGIKYDKTVLTVVEAVGADDVFSSNDAIINPDGDGFVGYMYGGIKDKNTTGKLMTITFKIKEGAAIGDYSISVGDVNGNMEASNFNGDTVGLTTEAGKVTVECKHPSVKNVEKTAASCTANGSTDVVCDKCGAVTKTIEVPALGHKYGEYATTKEPTCTEAGEKTATCSVCGDKKTEEIKALGHKYSEFTVTKEATDQEAGKMEAKCTVCGAVATIEIPVVKEADFVISDSEGKVFNNKVVAGEEVVLTFAGIGMEKAVPMVGDIRYVPASYKIDKKVDWTKADTSSDKYNVSPQIGTEVKWTEAPYTVTFNAEEAGTYEIVTVYNREIYTGTEWKTDGKNMSVKTVVEATEAQVPEATEAQVSEATEAETSATNSDSGVATGDDSASEIMILTMMCALSAGVLFVSSKKRKTA